VQIGGGVRVGDAFQAIVGLDLIAIWGMRFCVKISQTRHLCLVRFEQERQASISRKRTEGEATRAGNSDGRNEAAKRLNDFDVRMRRAEFEFEVR
jgi:hypothetical protein